MSASCEVKFSSSSVRKYLAIGSRVSLINKVAWLDLASRPTYLPQCAIKSPKRRCFVVQLCIERSK